MIRNLLDDREARYNRILGLWSKFHRPVVCGKLNYPGNVKNTPESDIAFEDLRNLVLELYEEKSF